MRKAAKPLQYEFNFRYILDNATRGHHELPHIAHKAAKKKFEAKCFLRNRMYKLQKIPINILLKSHVNISVSNKFTLMCKKDKCKLPSATVAYYE